MAKIETVTTAPVLFARTRQSLANAAQRLETRNRVARELNLLGDRALADIGLYRSDINAFAASASQTPSSEPLLVALAADLRQLLRTGHLATKAAE